MLDKAKNTGIPRRYLRNPNVRWFDVDLSDLQEILVEEKDVHKYELQYGDVVICEGGEAGRAALWKNEAADVIFQKAIHRVRVGPNLDARFLIHRLMFDYFNGGLEDYYTGATIKHFTGQDLARYEIPLPPLDEQRRIAAILDKADALRRKRKRAIEMLGNLTRSIFIEMFGGATANPHFAKTLSDVTTEIYRYPTYFGIQYEEQGVPEIRGELICDDGTIVDDPHKLRFIAKQTSERFPKTILSVGDLVMSVRGTIGKVGRVPESLAGANMTANLIRIAPDANVVEPEFLWFAMRSPAATRALTAMSASTTIATIKASDLRRIPVICPPLEAQRQFTSIARKHASLANLAMSHFKSSEALFSSLQHRAFSGQL